MLDDPDELVELYGGGKAIEDRMRSAAMDTINALKAIDSLRAALVETLGGASGRSCPVIRESRWLVKPDPERRGSSWCATSGPRSPWWTCACRALTASRPRGGWRQRARPAGC